MKISIDKVSKIGISESDAFELSIIGKVEDSENLPLAELSKLQDELKKRGVFFIFVSNENSEYCWMKLSLQDNPRKAGRKNASTKKQVSDLQIIRLLNECSNAEIITMLGVHPSTYYRAKKRMKENNLYKAILNDKNLNNVEKLNEQKDKYVDNNGQVYYESRFLHV